MVYFIRARNTGRIKIGTTVRLSDRLRQLASEYDSELEVLAVADGSFPEETSLHGRFAHLRAVGEWFEPGDDLIGFIVREGREWDGSDEAARLVSVKVDAEVVRKAKIVAAYRDVPLSEYLSEALRELVDRDLEAEQERERKGRHGKKGKAHPKKGEGEPGPGEGGAQ